MPKIADLLGIVGSTFTIGSRSLTAGLRQLAFRSGSFLGTINWTTTANRTITLPDASGIVLLDTTTVPLAEPRTATLRLGSGAGANNTSGIQWVAIGNFAGANNTSGGWTAIGTFAAANNTTGNNWTAIGLSVGVNNILGNDWVGVGAFAGTNTTAGGWTAIGYAALDNVTTGSNNTAIGSLTGRGITTGSNNTIVGANVSGLSPTLANNVILASGDGAIKLQIDSTGLATLPISPVFSNNSTLVATTAHVKALLVNSPSITLTVLRWVSGAFLGSLNWTPTAARTITLPDDTVTLLGDDRPVGALNSGVSLRGYEPIVTVNAATKTLALSDAGTVQHCIFSTGPLTITIPLNSAVAFPIGTRIIFQYVTQTINIALTGGVTVKDQAGGTVSSLAILNILTLRKTGTDSWISAVDQPRSTVSVLALEANRSTAQTITKNVPTTLICNVVQLDTNSAYNSTTGVFTVPTGQSGMYFFSVYCGFDSPGLTLEIVPVKNGTDQNHLRYPGAEFLSDVLFFGASSLRIRLVAGDTLKFDIFFNSSPAGTTVSTSTVYFPSIGISKLY